MKSGSTIKSIFTLLLYGIVSFFFMNLAVFILSDVLEINLNTDFKFSSPQSAFWMVVFFAPITETLVFQHGVILLLEYLTSIIKLKTNIAYYIMLLSSGLLFGLDHCYSVYYVIITLIIGCFFAWIYLKYYKQTGSSLKAFMLVCLVHGLSNLFTLFYSLYRF